ncbi:MAG: PKD domain-containing protein [Bacteroidota bacterium]
MRVPTTAFLLIAFLIFDTALAQVPPSQPSKARKKGTGTSLIETKNSTQHKKGQKSEVKDPGVGKSDQPVSGGTESTGQQSLFTLHADRTSVQIGEVVNFTILLQGTSLNASSTFFIEFRDGSPSQTVPVSQPQFTHVFQSEGMYAVVATLHPPVGVAMIAVYRPLRDSLAIGVTPVLLDAKPLIAEVGQQVAFRVLFKATGQNVRYRFWDDQNHLVADWQSDPEFLYTGKLEGSVALHADVEYLNDQKSPIVTRTVDRSVTFTQPAGFVELVARPEEVDAGGTVTFDVHTNINFPGLRYHFTFGDESSKAPTRKDPSTWGGESSITHVYRLPGTHLASVEVSYGKRLLSSPSIKIGVRGQSVSDPWPTRITWLVISLAILGGGYFARKMIFRPRARFVLVADDPLHNAKTSKAVRIGIQIILKTEVEQSESSFSHKDASLVKGIRRKNV